MKTQTLFFEQHPNPMFVFDTDTLEFLEVNKKATNKYGFERQEFRRLTIEDIHPPEDIPKLRDQLIKLNGTQQPEDVGLFRHRTKTGELLHVQLTTQLFPMKGRQARIVHVHDLTETIKLKQKVEEAYKEQRQHIENNPLGMVKYDENFRVIEWSQRAEEKTGYSKDEVLGLSSFEIGFFDEQEASFVKERMLEISSGEKEKDRFETRIRLKNGEHMEVKIHASALRNPDGDLKSVLAFIENITEQKDYERQLAKREQKFHRLFEEANDGIFLMNDLTFVDCNEQVTEILGASKEEIIGKTPLDFSPEVQPDGQLSAEKAREKMERVNNRQPQVFEWRHHTAEGDPIDVEISLNKIELGEDTYLQAIMRDLTEHKEIKNQLEAEQQRLKRAQKQARIGWWSYEANDDRVIWSDVLFDILDVDKKNFKGTFEDFYELIHHKDREKFARMMERAQQPEETLDYILRLQNPKTEEIIHAKCRAKSELDEQGNLTKLSGVLQDVTDQKKAQNELLRNKELFESLFINSPVAIAMIDVGGKVQKLNSSFEELFDYSEDELIGKDLLKHQLPEDRYDEIDEIYKHVFADEGRSKYYEDQRITKNGETKDLLVGALPVVLEGEPIAAFGIYTDITKLRETEQNLRDSLKEKEALLSEVHHRVKNNLAIISGLLLLEAMNWDDDTTVSKILMQSKLRIHSMAKIHEKLYESGSFTNIDLGNYITELTETIFQNMNIDDKDITLTVDCDEVTLNINQALPCALIINELVTNAFKYSLDEHSHAELEVGFKNEDEHITLIVSDNGPGLPGDFQDMTESSLGHRLVQQLVKQLGGDITVTSGEPKGTRYKITFEKAQKSGSSSNLRMKKYQR